MKFLKKAAAGVFLSFGGLFLVALVAILLEPEMTDAVPDYKQREVIKVVQKLTGLSWKEVKALVRDVPQPIQRRANRETAKAFQKELEAVGAQVSLVLN